MPDLLIIVAGLATGFLLLHKKNSLWKLIPFRYWWAVSKDYRAMGPGLELGEWTPPQDVYTCRWYPLAWLVYRFHCTLLSSHIVLLELVEMIYEQ